jgi:hypothetical protein
MRNDQNRCEEGKAAMPDEKGRSLLTSLFGRNERTPIGLGNQVKLLVAALVGVVLGSHLMIQGYYSLVPAGADLTQGEVIHSEVTKRWGIPKKLLTVRISGTETVVKAIDLDGKDGPLRDRVSFYYSGDPTELVYLPEQIELVYLGLFFIAVAGACVLVCFWDRIWAGQAPQAVTFPSQPPRRQASG